MKSLLIVCVRTFLLEFTCVLSNILVVNCEFEDYIYKVVCCSNSLGFWVEIESTLYVVRSLGSPDSLTYGIMEICTPIVLRTDEFLVMSVIVKCEFEEYIYKAVC